MSRRRLTFDPAFDLAPVWSPDGHRIAFTSNRRGPVRVHLEKEGPDEFTLYMKSADGTGTDELLAARLGADGAQRLVTRWTVHPVYDRAMKLTETSWRCRWRATESPVPVVATPFNETNAQFSPDGQWIAFQSNESGRPEIYVQPFRRPGQKVRISTEGGVQARWRGDGKELFYLAPDQRLMAVPIQLDAQRERGGRGNARGALHDRSGGHPAG